MTLAVFDVAGRRVRTLMDEPRLAGTASVTWDLRGEDRRRLGPGLYFASFAVDGRPVATQRVVVLP